MKSFMSLITLAAMIFTTPTFACGDHQGHGTSPKAGETSKTVCNEDSTVCMQLQFITDVNSREEGQFITKVQTPNGEAINNFKLDIWMSMGNHGHGSAPVEISDAGVNSYKISNAWFVMSGTWNVRVDFDYYGTHEHLEIPVLVVQ